MKHLFGHSVHLVHTMKRCKVGSINRRLWARVAVGICLFGVSSLGCRPAVSPSRQAGPIRANMTLESFPKAKRALYKLYADSGATFYCGCAFNERKIEQEQCGFKSRRFAERARRTEVEHVVPAHAFGQAFTSGEMVTSGVLIKKDELLKGVDAPSGSQESFG